MLRDELLPLITEIENKKIIFEINDAAIRIAANIKKVASRFLNRIIPMASIDSSSERYRQPVWNSSERSLRSGEVAIKNIVELKKRIKSVWTRNLFKTKRHIS